ncbi:MAG: 2-polyprenyl-6-methoxyphenol hydroxylase [Rhizobiales bacterium]|nr:2-polyprenyl-6-methoxyphenol hydroxylase [Hyphomicrobiales bacterium]
MPETTHIPVLIVGAGPVGLALAGDLGWRGVRCTLIEKTEGRVEHPKMDLIGVRTMEFCRRWGIADRVRDAPYPGDYPQDYVWLESFTGYEFGRETFPGRAFEPLPKESPQKRERVPQDMFDPIIKQWATEFPSVTLHHNTELIGFADKGTHVAATVRDVTTGETREITADYLIGTDGGASFVRETLGIGMSGHPALTYTTNVIFRCPDLPALHDKGKGYRFIFIGPEGTWLTIVAINGGDRFRMSIVGSPEKVTHSEADIHAALLRAMGKPFDYEILSVLRWVRRELVAESYGRGRVYIAGDAAHLTSPTGALGMNTGMQDAVDLGWKLDAVLKGWGGANLLATYEIERKPVAVRNIKASTDNLERMLAPRTTHKPTPVMFQPGPAGDAARKKYGEWYTELMRHEWFMNGYHLGYRYDDSPLVWPDGTPMPPFEGQAYSQMARPGARAPHAWIGEGRSTLDLYGRGFVLLRLGSDAHAGDGIVRAFAAAGIPLRVETITSPEVRKLHERALVLVRPDGHVAWRADQEPANATALADCVRGAGRLSQTQAVERAS